jgi:hypothetical protein
MLSYDAMNVIAHEIAARIKAASTDACSQRILIQDANTLAQLTAYLAFDSTAKRLLSQYQHVGRGFSAGGAPTSMLSEAASIMSAIRSSASYTSQTFQPTAASMDNILEAQLGKLSFSVHSTSNPGSLLDASQAINNQLAEIDAAQAKISDPSQRKDIDSAYTVLKTQLSAASPDGTLLATIIKGGALKIAMSDKYCSLSYSVDGAGGDTRISHPFLWEVLLPSPQPSYSGGAIVSFVYRTSDGNYLAGDSLRYFYGFSKLDGRKLSGAANFSPK